MKHSNKRDALICEAEAESCEKHPKFHNERDVVVAKYQRHRITELYEGDNCSKDAGRADSHSSFHRQDRSFVEKRKSDPQSEIELGVQQIQDNLLVYTICLPVTNHIKYVKRN
jgi:hypothetical protein